MKMKAISIKQPWASLVASGEKTIETRRWPTKYRGDLVIVSSLLPKIDNLPLGQAIAIAEIYDCRPMCKDDEKNACCEIYPNAFSWHLRNIRYFAPFKIKGHLSLYDVDFPSNIQVFSRQYTCL